MPRLFLRKSDAEADVNDPGDSAHAKKLLLLAARVQIEEAHPLERHDQPEAQGELERTYDSLGQPALGGRLHDGLLLALRQAKAVSDRSNRAELHRRAPGNGGFAPTP